MQRHSVIVLFCAVFYLGGMMARNVVAADDDVLLFLISHSDLHAVLTYSVPKARLDATAWRDRSKDVPLSARDAVRIANATLTPEQQCECHLNAVALMKPESEARDEWFFYMVNFWTADYHDQREVIILLDGTVIRPISKDTKT
ncbi:MAG TPA: hypothetical protein VJU77_12960 [Chthoniobacterales bacterium]|nr:hypothetical protein [Chthoniobacterales bacterium]